MFLFCRVFAMSLCASIYMCFVVTCWERADLLALVYGVCCEFVTFPLVSWVRCQGLFLANLIAVIGLYSQCQKVSFFPNFWRKGPNFKSDKKLNKIHHFYRGKSWLKTVEYSTLHNLI